MAMNGCGECLKKPQEIDRLTEALHRLKQQLRYQERQATEGFFGSATPSAKLPVKTNTPPPPAPKPKGARPGHPGAGRQAFDARQAERVIEIPPVGGDRCPTCDTLLEDKGTGSRAVIESHPVREVQDLEKEFPDAAEVTALVSTVAPPLALAMGLRAQPISDAEFSRQAVARKAPMMASMDAPSRHLGIRRIQEIFRANADRLYHWADDRRVPAENNLAERDLRPTVIARKVSFGSQSDAGAHTRGILMSVLQTLKKRGDDVVAHLKGVLDRLADDIHQDPWPLLFPKGPT
jgi:hypothetical protein